MGSTRHPCGAALLLLLLLPGGCSWQRPPEELIELRAVADPLLRANHVRSGPIHFTLESGETAPFWATQAGLCPTTVRSQAKENDSDPCESWAHDAPGQSSNEGRRRVERLAYLLGTAGVRTYAHGLIGFDRSYFLIHRHDPAGLRCVIAHELTHFLRRHAYLSSRIASERPEGMAEEARLRADASLSQQQELAADRNAMLMTAIAGHDPADCIIALQADAELLADHPAEDPLGTHPGHRRRIAAARAYLRQGLANDLRIWREQHRRPTSSPPSWTWNAADQLLTVETLPVAPQPAGGETRR
jgi:hypothetical protein